jgi:hypothetical protein
MTNTAKTETALRFDPWLNAGPAARVEPTPQWAPDSWYLLTATARLTIGGLALTTLRSHPDRRSQGDRDWLAAQIRHQLAALRAAGDEAADATMVELDRNPKLNGSFVLREAVGKLLEAGSHLLTLRQQRSAIDRAIEHLTSMAGPR